MKLEVTQHTLKCKEELDRILAAIETIKVLLFDNDLDEIYEATVNQLEELRVMTHSAIESLSKAYEEFVFAGDSEHA